MECPACLSSQFLPADNEVRDFEHGLDIKVNFISCVSCGHLLMETKLSQEQKTLLYPKDYRPHASAINQKGFSLLAQLQKLRAALRIRALRKALPTQDKEILEIGCATGQLLFALRQKGFLNLSGIDLSEDLASNFKGSGIKFCATNGEEEWPISGSFNLIIMNYVLEHFEFPERVLANCKRHLAADGKIILLTPNPNSFCHKFFGQFWSGLHAPRHPNLFSPLGLQIMAKRIGFSEPQIINQIDPAAWALSLQNCIASFNHKIKPHAKAITWHTYLHLPFWLPWALLEYCFQSSSTHMVILTHSSHRN